MDPLTAAMDEDDNPAVLEHTHDLAERQASEGSSSQPGSVPASPVRSTTAAVATAAATATPTGAIPTSGSAGGEPLDGAGAKVRSRSRPGEEQVDLLVAVTNPEKHGDGLLDSHIVYTVETTSTRESFGGSKFSVHRRYSDFIWLRDLLVHELSCNIIPPMPPKHQLKAGKTDPEFVERRRAGLDRFLKRIAAHPVLSHNETFRVFLTAKSHELTTFKKEKDRGVLAKMSESVGLLATKLILKNPDCRFQAMQQYIISFEEQMKNLESLSERSVLLFKDVKTTTLEFSVTFNALAELEDHLSPSLQEMHRALQQQAASLTVLSSSVDANLLEVVKEYRLFGEGILHLLKRRDSLELDRQVLDEDLYCKKSERRELEESDQKLSFGALFGKTPEAVKAEKLEKNSQEIEQMTRQLESVGNAVEVANASIIADMSRWHEDKEADFAALFVALADANIEHLTNVRMKETVELVV
eukprot:m.59686 g.59686  ORF g.59686 m.59686 type:complete len:471 (-) comp16015_c0_seq2:153-1565(-)